MHRLLRILVIVVGSLFAIAGGCAGDDLTADEAEPPAEEETEQPVQPDEQPLQPADPSEDPVDEVCEDCADEDPSINPDQVEFCDGIDDDECTSDPEVYEEVWGHEGTLTPRNDWQTDPTTSRRGPNELPPMEFFLVDLPDGVVPLDGDWGLFGVRADGVGLEVFTEAFDPRDPGCAPTSPTEAGAFLIDADRRNVVVADGWTTCLARVGVGERTVLFAYLANEGGLADFSIDIVFGEGPADWSIDIEANTATGHAPSGAVFPIVGDFDGDGEDDIEWWADNP